MEEIPTNPDQSPNLPPPAKEKSPEEIYQLFKTFARDFFDKHPPSTKAEQGGGKAFHDYSPELDESETEFLKTAATIDPDKFLQLFIADPPEILIDQSTDPEKLNLRPTKPNYLIIQPTPEEVELTAATVSPPEQVSADEELLKDFEVAILNFKSFVKLPIVEDGFGELHDQLRRPYRVSLQILAGLIEKQNHTQDESFLNQFITFYTENRLVGNKQGHITTGIDLLRKPLELPNHKESPWIDRLKEIIKAYDETNPPPQQTGVYETTKWIEEEITKHPVGSNERLSLENALEKMKPKETKQPKLTTTQKQPVYTQIATDILRLFSASQTSNHPL